MWSRRTYAQEYKREAVQLARVGDVPVSQVARDLGINANMMGRWCREMQGSARKAFPGAGKARDEEIVALKRERVNGRQYRIRAEVNSDVFDYIERFHNPPRRRQMESIKLVDLLLTQPSV
jgi:transposase